MKAPSKTFIDYHYHDNGQLSRQQGEPEIEAPELPKPVDMSYDTDNRLINYNGQTLSYDPNGNLLNSPFGNYGYDSRNRLTEAGTLSYTYDAENRRIAIESPEGTTQLIHNPNALLSQLLVRKTPNEKTTYYVYGLGLLYQETDNQAKYYHYDQQGNTLLLTDQSGQVTDQFSYSPYGETIKREGTTETPFRYNGRFGVMTDSNGLLQMRARYYSPEIKRFLNQDVLLGNIAEPITLNRFAYANGDPINNIDPLGLIGWGLGVNASGTVGLGTGATAGASAAGGFFLGPNPNGTQGSLGGYVSYGAAAGLPGSESIGHYGLGGGAAIYAFFTNADNADQLSQTTDTAFINIGFGIDLNFSFSWGNGVGLVEVGTGPGGGLSIGHIQTTTYSGTLPVASSK